MKYEIVWKLNMLSNRQEIGEVNWKTCYSSMWIKEFDGQHNHNDAS